MSLLIVPPAVKAASCSPCDTHLAMVGAAVLGHGTLAVHQETVPATLLGQGCLVSLGDEGVQLGLLTADGLHKLVGGGEGNTQ